MDVNKSACVTGADRGIGLALSKALLLKGYTVFAGGIQQNNAELDAFAAAYPGRLHRFVLDVGSDSSVREAAELIRSCTDRLDLLVNNAAILGDTKNTIADELDFEEIQRVYNVSALGAIRMSNALIMPVMNGGKLIVNISSEAGSIGSSFRDSWFGYCMAKSALNMGSTLIHNRMRKNGGRVLLIHPGWVKTRMSGVWNDAGTYTPEEAAANIMKRIDEFGEEIQPLPMYVEADTGNVLPW